MCEADDGPLDRARIVYCLQKARHIDSHCTSHDLRHTEDNAHHVDRETGVREECIEEYAERLTAVDDAEDVE